MQYLKSQLSKINFELHRNPRLELPDGRFQYVPEPYKAVFLLQADFELAWAWQFSKSSEQPLQKALQHARTERANIPHILQLCDRYAIPITWATVGHLFLEQCNRSNDVAHAELPRLPFFENQYWHYKEKDWFANDPCSHYQQAPEWYAPDLIRQILDSQAGHEMACHTFSHIDCSDAHCPSGVLRAEIQACQQAATAFGVQLRSFVHPAHTIGNIAVLADLGITSFRTDYGNTLGYPLLHPGSIWELKSTLQMNFRSHWSIQYHNYRYKKVVDRAIKNRSVCCFWFHPSIPSDFLNDTFTHLFQHLDRHRNEIWITTTGNYFEWLNKQIQ